MITIDGSMGEGGGQILRSALSLSLLSGQPFRLLNIRAGRSRPGLRPQHLAAVTAASRISRARVSGAHIGSAQLQFEPGEVEPGRYHFNITTAGATSLVLQTILLPLAQAPGSSHITITGGTHVPWSPCFHYLDWHWRPLLARLGIPFELTLRRAGFYPAGGGEIVATIPGAAVPKGVVLEERGALRRLCGLSALANLPLHIAERQRERALSRLKQLLPGVVVDIPIEPLSAYSPGTLLLLLAEFEQGQGCFFALGAKGKPAELVADEAVDALATFLQSRATVDPWLADQLLLPLAVAAGESVIHTSEVTPHLLTNAGVIRYFLPTLIEVEGPAGEPALIRVVPHKP